MKKALIGIIIAVVVVGGAVYLMNKNGTTPNSQASPSASYQTSPAASPSPTGQAKTSPTPDARCIITVDGQRYDVSSYRNVHPGGDVFQCGTDMSAAFHAQHGDGAKQLQIMQSLKVN